MSKNTQDTKNKGFAGFNMKMNAKTLFIVVLSSLVVLTILTGLTEGLSVHEKLPVSVLLTDIKAGKIEKIERSGNKLVATYKNGNILESTKEAEDSFRQMLVDSDIDPDTVNVEVITNEDTSLITAFVLQVIPTLLIIIFFIFIFRQARGAQDSIFSFGQAKSKRYVKKISRITFKDVAGVDEAKEELREIVDFLKNPVRYKKLGARSPKGVLLIGPAGTGKTLLAKAVAGESNVPFFSIAGSEFMEMLVGIGAARVRDLFANAKKNAPSIIFIDEIDAIGRSRSAGAMPAHDEREQTLNQILVEMDGFSPNDQVVVVAASNRGDLLDAALLRPGRFDRRVMLDYPDLEGRAAILQIHAKNKPFHKNVSWEKLARRTVGFSGADIENMLNEAAISAARQRKNNINMEDLEEAATKVKLGPEKKRLQSDLDKKITAYHESGHAIVTHFQKESDPVHRISIVSRGMSLGHTLIPPSIDRLHHSRTQLRNMIISMLGGRVAEEISFKDITTGAANDFDQATSVARNMVVEYGMSELGPINFGPTNDITEWGQMYYDQVRLSQETQNNIDNAIRKIIEECYQEAKNILTKHKKELDKVAEALIQHESLDEDEFVKIVGKKQTS